jgi:hypothetical protein
MKTSPKDIAKWTILIVNTLLSLGLMITYVINGGNNPIWIRAEDCSIFLWFLYVYLSW